jgi:adenylate cyclase
MAIKDLIIELEGDVIDVINTTFNYYDAYNVPRRSDSQLTFERGVEKKGKAIHTCVLFVDIRDSVALTIKHHSITMGRIYTAFTKGVLKIAKHHEGHIRNVIGDRVMIVFPSNNCFINAVDCAISINHFAQNIMNKKFTNVDFKCGIGIDYGKLKVLKVGIPRRGHEQNENRALVWTGYPANIASRLTDVANKTIEETYFEVVKYPVNPRALKPFFELPSPWGASPLYDPNAPLYLSTTQIVKLTSEEFADSIKSYSEGDLSMTGGKFVSFSKKYSKIHYSEILMTSDVYNGLKAADPDRNSIKNKSWIEQTRPIKDVDKKVYGGDIKWNLT